METEVGHGHARAVDRAGQGIIEGARQNPRRRRLADASHARENIGLVNPARGEGIGERAHHRLLADQVLEAHRPIFSRQHPIGGAHRRGWSFGSREERIAQRRPLLAGKGRWRSILSFASLDEPPLRGEGELKLTLAWSLTPNASVGGWTKTRPGSLGLLPSGPDPVGERYVLRQPPAAYVDHEAAGHKGRARPPIQAALACSSTMALA